MTKKAEEYGAQTLDSDRIGDMVETLARLEKKLEKIGHSLDLVALGTHQIRTKRPHNPVTSERPPKYEETDMGDPKGPKPEPEEDEPKPKTA